MKKLTYLMSALLAVVGFSSAASADVSVSGSGSLTISSDGTDTETYLASGIAFALSTTTANGMSISTSGSVSNGSDQGTDSVAGAGGFTSVAFGLGSSTITVGKVEVPNGHGDIGGVVSDMTAQGANAADADAAFGVNGTLEAAGVSLATAVGGASVTIGYVYDGSTAGLDSGDISNGTTATGVSASMPMGNITVGLGYTTDGTQNETGASAALALGGGTLTLGYGTVTASAANETVMGATYAASLDADTSVTVGYKNISAADTESTMGIALSRSLGGGASVFLEAVNYSISAGTDIGIGTSFAF